MNNKGITFLFLLMLGTTIIVLGLALAQPIKEFVDTARTEMNCAAPVDKYYEATCYGLDILKPLITGGIILVGIAVITAKVIFKGAI